MLGDTTCDHNGGRFGRSNTACHTQVANSWLHDTTIPASGVGTLLCDVHPRVVQRVDPRVMPPVTPTRLLVTLVDTSKLVTRPALPVEARPIG